MWLPLQTSQPLPLLACKIPTRTSRLSLKSKKEKPAFCSLSSFLLSSVFDSHLVFSEQCLPSVLHSPTRTCIPTSLWIILNNSRNTLTKLKETRFSMSARQLRVQINAYSFLDISKNEPDGEFTEDLIISMIIWCQMLLDWILYPYSVTQLDAGKIGYYPSYFA